MSTIIPNSTPTPNFYYDQLMHLLTANEWVILSYAVRRIFGFEKNRISLKAKISLSTFENGVSVTDDTGEIIRLAHGCGLSRPVIKDTLNSLVQYGIMLPGPKTKEGQVWALETDEGEIDTPALIRRVEEKKEKGKKRISKAAKASAEKRKKQGGTTNVLDEVVGDTYQTQYDTRTNNGTTSLHTESNKKETGKQDSTVATANATADGDTPPSEEKPEAKIETKEKPTKPAKPEYWGDLVVEVRDAFNEPMGIAVKIAEQLLGIATEEKRAEHNVEVPAQLGQVKEFMEWYNAECPGCSLRKAEAVASWWHKFISKDTGGDELQPFVIDGKKHMMTKQQINELMAEGAS